MSTIEQTDPRTWAGYRAHTIARSTGTLCVLVNPDEFGEFGEGCDGLPWMLVCHEHGGMCGFEGQRPARDHLAHPEQWCPTCQEQHRPGEQIVKREPRRRAERTGPSSRELAKQEKRRMEERAAAAEFATGKLPTLRQLEASIRTGLQNADEIEASGGVAQPAIIRARCADWQEQIERGEYR